MTSTATASASAPASSANLGPGFDTLALALELRCTVSASRSAEWSVDHAGEHRPIGNEVDAVMLAARRAVGDSNPLHLTVQSDIPVGKGLGSSAAALVAGVAAALRVVEKDFSPDHVFRIASEMEGHPDNVAAAVYGGLVLVPAEGLPIRLPLHPSINVVVGVPEERLSTEVARASVAHDFPRDVVVRSLSRVAALTAGLMSADPLVLAAAHGDEIHEQPRSMTSPEVDLLIQRVRNAGSWHAARSGAGPAVIALCGSASVGPVTDAFRAASVDVLRVGVAATGLV